MQAVRVDIKSLKLEEGQTPASAADVTEMELCAPGSHTLSTGRYRYGLLST